MLLLDCGQDHLFDDWDEPGTRDEEKLAFLKQVEALHAAYPGGLNAYCTRARSLLYDAKQGTNPYSGYAPIVPSGSNLEPGSDEYLKREKKGCEKLGKMGFVLVAGGLGERLGHDGIKVELPAETLTCASFLQTYIASLLAIQRTSDDPSRPVPLVIMTSADTHEKTLALLRTNDYFGMPREQARHWHRLCHALLPFPALG